MFINLSVQYSLLALDIISGRHSFIFFFLFYKLLVIIPTFAIAIRRAHDTGHNGWWMFIPFYNFYLLFKKGDVETNRFGPPTVGLSVAEIERQHEITRTEMPMVELDLRNN
jgi:uncharacterized membrane protein YhaH (DUF805 family)